MPVALYSSHYDNQNCPQKLPHACLLGVCVQLCPSETKQQQQTHSSGDETGVGADLSMKVIPPKVSGFEDEGSLRNGIQQWPAGAGNDPRLTQPARRQET